SYPRVNPFGVAYEPWHWAASEEEESGWPEAEIGKPAINMIEKSEPFHLRRAGERDWPEVMACLAATFEPDRERYTAGAFEDTVPTGLAAERRFREMTVLVAEVASRGIIGTIAHRITGPGQGHLRGMAVLPEFQGRGVAERLLLAAEEELRKLGCSRV